MSFNRRRFLQTSALALPALPGGSVFAQAPAVVTSERERPQILSGVQAGDVAGLHAGEDLRPLAFGADDGGSLRECATARPGRQG